MERKRKRRRASGDQKVPTPVDFNRVANPTPCVASELCVPGHVEWNEIERIKASADLKKKKGISGPRRSQLSVKK